MEVPRTAKSIVSVGVILPIIGHINFIVSIDGILAIIPNPRRHITTVVSIVEILTTIFYSQSCSNTGDKKLPA